MIIMMKLGPTLLSECIHTHSNINTQLQQPLYSAWHYYVCTVIDSEL